MQRVVISGQAGGDKGAVVDFNNRSRETNRTKEMAMWLSDDEQVEAIERREAEVVEEEQGKGGGGGGKKAGGKRKGGTGGGSGGGTKKEMSMDDMYHEGEYPSSDSETGVTSELGNLSRR